MVRNRSATRALAASGSYGFGSRVDRFTAIQSSPSSPMVESSPLKWFIRDIDIGDSGKVAQSSDPPPRPGRELEMFGHRPIRTRSRHDCHFSTGSSVPMGRPLFGHFFSSFPSSHDSIFICSSQASSSGTD